MAPEVRNLVTRFLDTSALLELARGREGFRALAVDALTSHANLLEFHYHVTRRNNERLANDLLWKYWSLAVAPNANDVADASRLRVRASDRRFSFIDALGYAMAQNRRLTFVTDDPAFEGLPMVEMPNRPDKKARRSRKGT